MLRSRDGQIYVSLAVACILLAVCVMLIDARPSLHKPFIMDEMEFPAVAHAIAQTGRPVYYRGETAPENVGLWHPPLYILTLAAWQRVVGSSVADNRAFGLANACLALVLMGIFAVRRLDWNRGNWRAALPVLLALLIGLGLAATSPLLVQGSMLPDIDTQVLPLTITAFFLLLFELRRQQVRERVYWLAFVLALVVQFFAKLTTPVLLIPAFMLFELVRNAAKGTLGLRIRFGGPGQQTPRSTSQPQTYRMLIAINATWGRIVVQTLLPLVMGVAAVLVFVISWFLVARIWDVSFRLPFLYLTQSANNPAHFGNGTVSVVTAIISAMPANFRYFAQWVGYPALAFVLLMIGREWFKPVDGILNRAERVALATFFLLLTLMYVVLKPAPFEFPKYYPPLIPPLALLGIDLLVSLYRQGRLALAGSVLVLEVGAYLASILLSGQFSNHDFIYELYWNWPKEPFFWAWMELPLLTACVINGLLWLITRRRFAAPLVIGALAVTLGWQVTMAAKQDQVTYSTSYYYGEESLQKVSDYLRATLPPGAILIAPKDVGYRLQDQWRYIELGPDPRPYLLSPNVAYLVMRSNDYYGNTVRDTPEVAASVNSAYEQVIKIENFVVMKRRV